MSSLEYSKRRAKPGFAKEKARCIKEIRFAEAAINHLVIRNDQEALSKARENLASWIKEVKKYVV